MSYDKWDWLLANHPWKYADSDERANVMLGLVSDGATDPAIAPEIPAVIIMDTYWDGGQPGPNDTYPGSNWCITGDTWEHAIENAIRKVQNP